MNPTADSDAEVIASDCRSPITGDRQMNPSAMPHDAVVYVPARLKGEAPGVWCMDLDTDELLASLTPREENPAIKTYQNTVSVACPACEEPFDDLVVCKQNPTSLNLSKQLDLCVGVEDGQAFIFTHKP